ncbi:hypothetical protein B484DRAFT_465800 [Ochromonadaceae sp. CCMP2298]|nr:hypothetical protein B484DRAFT_465800 [Ochromonadaceae sp. CCMP2298]
MTSIAEQRARAIKWRDDEAARALKAGNPCAGVEVKEAEEYRFGEYKPPPKEMRGGVKYPAGWQPDSPPRPRPVLIEEQRLRAVRWSDEQDAKAAKAGKWWKKSGVEMPVEEVLSTPKTEAGKIEMPGMTDEKVHADSTNVVVPSRSALSGPWVPARAVVVAAVGVVYGLRGAFNPTFNPTTGQLALRPSSDLARVAGIYDLDVQIGACVVGAVVGVVVLVVVWAANKLCARK